MELWPTSVAVACDICKLAATGSERTGAKTDRLGAVPDSSEEGAPYPPYQIYLYVSLDL